MGTQYIVIFGPTPNINLASNAHLLAQYINVPLKCLSFERLHGVLQAGDYAFIQG